jgi:hypothetical protein
VPGLSTRQAVAAPARRVASLAPFLPS